jgi:hypothetical protein
MKYTYIGTLLLLAATSSLAWEPSSDDKEAAAKYYQDRVARLRTRSVLEARAVCTNIDCMDGSNGECIDNGCAVCSDDYYCRDYSTPPPSPPSADQIVILVSASDIKAKQAVLTNFVEAS